MTFPVRNLPVCTFESRTKGPALPGMSTIEMSSPIAESGAYSSDTACLGTLVRVAVPYQAFRDSTPSLSRTTSFRRAPNRSTEEAHLVKIILNQPNRRRVSTDRVNHMNSQLVASLEGDFNPTPVGETLPHSYPITRVRRERVQDGSSHS